MFNSAYGTRRSVFSLRRFLILGAVALIAYGFWTFYPRFARASTVELPAGLTRTEVAERIGESLGWGESDAREFSATFAKMQWMAFVEHISDLFEKRYGWGEDETEVFLTSSTRYVESQYDFLAGVYAPGAYSLRPSDSFATIADALIEPVAATTSVERYIEERLDEKAADSVALLVLSHFEKLPDLVPLPPQDLKLERSDAGDLLLRFTTSFYNKGTGPLELRADPDTAGIRKDVERTVFQRVYRKDGTTRERLAGTFLWHQSHLHYHFADFAVYDLEAIKTSSQPPDLSGVRQKSTFCIRDVSHTDLKLPEEPKDATFKICGKELQGISVGWADTYFFSYPDQLLNIEELPSGTYRLKFVINPMDRFDEADMSSNTSSAVIRFDREKETVEIESEDPATYPNVEHVYPEQDCPNCYG